MTGRRQREARDGAVGFGHGPRLGEKGTVISAVFSSLDALHLITLLPFVSQCKYAKKRAHSGRCLSIALYYNMMVIETPNERSWQSWGWCSGRDHEVITSLSVYPLGESNVFIFLLNKWLIVSGKTPKSLIFEQHEYPEQILAKWNQVETTCIMAQRDHIHRMSDIKQTDSANQHLKSSYLRPGVRPP